MPTSLVSTGVQFPDSTIQTTAASGSPYIQSLRTYDSSLSFAGNLYSSASDGNIKIQCVQLTATTELVFFYGSGGTGIYAAVWNDTTKTFGATTLINSADIGPSGGLGTSQDNFASIQVSSNTVLACWLLNNLATLTAVVITVSGTTISVGTPTTVSSSVGYFIVGGFNNGYNRLQQCGSSYVLSVWDTAIIYFRAMTVSGTTVTIGSQLSYNDAVLQGPPLALAMSSSVFGVAYIRNDQNPVYRIFSVSGTTLTSAGGGFAPGGTAAASGGTYAGGVLSTGRMIFCYRRASEARAVIFDQAGNANSAAFSPILSTSNTTAQVIGDRLFVCGGSNDSVVIQDNAGTPSVGSSFSTGTEGSRVITFFDGTNVYLGRSFNGPNPVFVYSTSGTTATLNAVYPSAIITSNTTGAFTASMPAYNLVYANLEYSGNNYSYGNIYNSARTKVAAIGNTGAICNTGLSIPSVTTGSVAVYSNSGLAGSTQFYTRSAINSAAGFVAAFYGAAPNFRNIGIKRVELT